MHCAIWYHLRNLINVKNTHRGVLILVKLQAEAPCGNICQLIDSDKCLKNTKIFTSHEATFFHGSNVQYAKNVTVNSSVLQIVSVSLESQNMSDFPNILMI